MTAAAGRDEEWFVPWRVEPDGDAQLLQRLDQAVAAGEWLWLMSARAGDGRAGEMGDGVPTPPPRGRVMGRQGGRHGGVVLASGGSQGGRSWCLQPWDHLDQSAAACGRWIKALGVDPAQTLLLNPLPADHISGLMPLWRSRLWGAEHRRLSPALMKQPQALRATCQRWPGWGRKPALVSLVPTQLKRLMDHPDGVAWLQQLALVWVGGAGLPASLAERARRLGLPLSPCYGSTETAAMVAAQTPDRFLQGEDGCGAAFDDVALAVDAAGVLRVRTARLALARWRHGRWASLADSEGWWQTGDAAVLTPQAAGGARLTIQGRMDGAIHSGGETVFPEQLAQRLMHQAHGLGLPLETVLLLPVASEEWGQRLVALVKRQHGGEAMPWPQLQAALVGISRQWMPAERPHAWYPCQELETTAAGKWQLARWQAWLVAQSQGNADE